MITTPEQWAVMASAAKMRVLRVFLDHRERDAMEVSALIGQAPQSVYPHLYDLEAAGFVERVPNTRPARFRFPWSTTLADWDDATGRNSVEMDRAMSTIFRAADRAFTDRTARLSARGAERLILSIEEVTLHRLDADRLVQMLRDLLTEARGLAQRDAASPPRPDDVRIFLLGGSTHVGVPAADGPTGGDQGPLA